MPTAFPGFSWDDLRQTAPGRTMIARRKGEFYWRQFAIFKGCRNRTVFVGMFDEVDEETAIYTEPRKSVPDSRSRISDLKGFPGNDLQSEIRDLRSGDDFLVSVLPY